MVPSPAPREWPIASESNSTVPVRHRRHVESGTAVAGRDSIVRRKSVMLECPAAEKDQRVWGRPK